MRAPTPGPRQCLPRAAASSAGDHVVAELDQIDVVEADVRLVQQGMRRAERRGRIDRDPGAVTPNPGSQTDTPSPQGCPNPRRPSSTAQLAGDTR